MVPNVTFFYDRQRTSGATDQFGGSGRVYYVYSRSRLGRSYRTEFARPINFSDEAACEEFRTRLLEAIEAAGGGALVEEMAHRAGNSFEFLQVPEVREGGGVGKAGKSRKARGAAPGSGSSDASEKLSILLLEPGCPARPIPYKGVDLGRGCHLVVPVDSDAFRSLKELTGFLKWFSSDVESLFFNTLWQPGYERRIERIERKVGVLPFEPRDKYSDSVGQFRAILGKASRWFRRHLSTLTFVLVLVLLLKGMGVGAWFSELIKGGEVEPGSTTTTPVSEVTTTATVRGEEVTTTVETSTPIRGEDVGSMVDGQLEELMGLLQRVPEGSDLGRLFKSHFKASSAISRAGLRDDVLFAWGFVKLVILREDGAPSDQEFLDKFLDQSGQRSLTKQRLKPLVYDINGRKEELDMLALVTCEAFEENRTRNTAGLPWVGDDKVKGRVDLSTNCQMDDDKLREAAAGLRDLNEYVRGRLDDNG